MKKNKLEILLNCDDNTKKITKKYTKTIYSEKEHLN